MSIDEREVTISGSLENLRGMLQAAITQLDEGGDAALYVRGNGEPDLTLRFAADNDPENTEPLAEYGVL